MVYALVGLGREFPGQFMDLLISSLVLDLIERLLSREGRAIAIRCQVAGLLVLHAIRRIIGLFMAGTELSWTSNSLLGRSLVVVVKCDVACE